ncbi:peptidoglycan recognition family protein [Streptomyces sp. IB201691-2A2]|uniref:peptidoglycan recognition protein family protein n=1 Tax=Streptomyces sp. IB201691-2A2 TaxID=2561920 RepID=UPI00163D985E|nr:peptidoglycan recognition family protein [Streptomyces sp. IB201691-2A2]
MTTLGITWTGPQRGLQVRMFGKKGNPGTWQPVNAGCQCGKDRFETGSNPAVATHRALVAANDGYGYQIDRALGMNVINAIAIDSRSVPPLAKERAGCHPWTESSLPRTRPGDPRPTSINFITRKQWGADESKRFAANGSEKAPPLHFPAQALTVHHTVTVNNDPDPAATVRAIYEQHATANDWGDIGYHFLIDQAGGIYEGRFPGSGVERAHHTRDRLVTGFHTAGFNSGNIGIALLGDFTEIPPTTAMRRSLTRLLASLAKAHRLDVQSPVAYRNPASGTAKRVPAVAGHRDWIATDCPGTTTYMNLGPIRSELTRLLTA